MKKYVVPLTDEERQQLEQLLTKGKAAARTLRHAQALLKADQPEGWKDADIAEAFALSVRTVERLRQRFVEEGLEAALQPKPVPRLPRKVDGTVEAHLVALACSDPPEGRRRWTLRLLAGKLVELALVGSISHEGGAPGAQNNELKPWQKKSWRLPPYGSGEFVCQMEDVLRLYQLPYDPDYPQVCLDETNKQLLGEVCQPLPCQPGQPDRYESHYLRAGVSQVFLWYEPLAGRRGVRLRDHKGAVDWAEVIAELLAVHYPRAKQVRLVMDQLNTHAGGSLYQAFAPARARALDERLESQYTPQHGSWLNMAESELSVLTGQCLNRRIGTSEELLREVAAGERQRNEAAAKIDRRFTTDKARIKLKKLYPTIKT